MWRYVAKRLAWLLVTVVCVAILIFTVMHFSPGDPAYIILGSSATEAELEAERELLGLNRPFLIQLADFLYHAFLRFDFGNSWTYGVPVVDELANRLPRTVTLGLITIFFNFIFGIPIGIMAALNRGKWQDQGVMVASMALVSIPQFWFALLLVILFTVKLKLLPAYGIGTWKHWIMPVAASAMGGIAMLSRQTRSAVLETINSDFVTTAKAKGLSNNVVVYKHTLPNALIPILNVIGGSFASIVAGSAIIETVFSFPGVGTYMLVGISNRDYPIVQTCVLLLSIFSSLCMLAVDIAYAYLDPRIKAQYIQYAGAKHKKGGKV